MPRPTAALALVAVPLVALMPALLLRWLRLHLAVVPALDEGLELTMAVSRPRSVVTAAQEWQRRAGACTGQPGAW